MDIGRHGSLGRKRGTKIKEVEKHLTPSPLTVRHHGQRESSDALPMTDSQTLAVLGSGIVSGQTLWSLHQPTLTMF